MMKRIFLEIAKEYEQYGIKGIEENADATAMWLIKNPQDYSVVVASNVFGDILSDEASQLTGGSASRPPATSERTPRSSSRRADPFRSTLTSTRSTRAR